MLRSRFASTGSIAASAFAIEGRKRHPYGTPDLQGNNALSFGHTVVCVQFLSIYVLCIWQDAVLDLKTIESPMRLLVSSSRDGEIKLWR